MVMNNPATDKMRGFPCDPLSTGKLPKMKKKVFGPKKSEGEDLFATHHKPNS
jgi:hypothetical protein